MSVDVYAESSSDLLRPALADEFVQRLLATVQRHLGMELICVTRVEDGLQTVEDVYRAVGALPIEVGVAGPHESFYCAQVLGETGCGVVRDAQLDARTRELPITGELGIGSYVGATIRLADGSRYGTLCAFGRQPQLGLRQRDAQLLAAFADLLSEVMTERQERARRLAAIARRANRILAETCPASMYQAVQPLPVVSLLGSEAWLRFSAAHASLGSWFTGTEIDGLGADMELAVIADALSELAVLPPSALVTINVAPEVLLDPRLGELLARSQPYRIILEVTDPVSEAEDAAVRAEIRRMRGLGMRVVTIEDLCEADLLAALRMRQSAEVAGRRLPAGGRQSFHAVFLLAA